MHIFPSIYNKTGLSLNYRSTDRGFLQGQRNLNNICCKFIKMKSNRNQDVVLTDKMNKDIHKILDEIQTAATALVQLVILSLVST